MNDSRPPSGRTLYDKVLDLHTVRRLPSGRRQLLIGLHLLNEVSSPQAFGMLEERGLSVLCPERTFATTDHIVPTMRIARPWVDQHAEAMQAYYEGNLQQHQLTYFPPGSGRQGIVHVIGPELGLTHPGLTICCGDSHTSTLGAFGALAFGIGASAVRDVLATQCLPIADLRVRRIDITGRLAPGVSAKDVILTIIRRLGVHGGIGHAYEYGGEVIDAMSMDERMTVCNMSIEGGARYGYVNPDDTTFEYLRGRPFAPPTEQWDQAVEHWRSIASDPDASYHDRVVIDGSKIRPMVTWGVNPAQCVGMDEPIPSAEQLSPAEREIAEDAWRYMALQPGRPVAGVPIDVAFIGSCANSRISDYEAAVSVVRSAGRKLPSSVRGLIVPGSEQILEQLRARGWAAELEEAGFEVRRPGCSMCIGMNDDVLRDNELCASTSTRNFKGRQGSPTGRTLLMSPAAVAASALLGRVTDPRDLLTGGASR